MIGFQFLCLLIVLTVVSSSVLNLGRYNISSDFTVSGISSGAYMAVQMHVSYSSLIKGAAIFAGGPWYCAESNLLYAEDKCMSVSLGKPQTQLLIDLALADASLGLIDSPFNMKENKIYLYSGKLDTVIDPLVVKELEHFYKAFVNAKNIVANYNVNSEHCMPTLDYGEECQTLSSPYIGKCQFDGAGAGLNVLFDNSLIKTKMIESNLIPFDQTPFFSGKSTSIGEVGYVYVPTACQSGSISCHLHISFHGCGQTINLIGNEYALYSGYNEWAEGNNIIILYPYATTSDSLPLNPNG
jgi:predicted esterase